MGILVSLQPVVATQGSPDSLQLRHVPVVGRRHRLQPDSAAAGGKPQRVRIDQPVQHISLTWAPFFYKCKVWPAQEYRGIMHRKDDTGDIMCEYQQIAGSIQVDGLFFLPDVDTVAPCMK